MAELVSAYPTAGGMYFVTKHVVPKEHVAIWAWIIGWCNFLGQAGGVASLAYTISQMILAAAVMNSSYDSNTGLYSFTPYKKGPSHPNPLSANITIQDSSTDCTSCNSGPVPFRGNLFTHNKMATQDCVMVCPY